ncbi:MAG: hypothetical protein EOP04_01070, partial [Proteobacteria bacterium]
MQRLIEITVLVHILFFSGYGRASESKAGVDVNDVAVLFPLDSNQRLFPDVTLAGGAEFTALLSATQLSELLVSADRLGVKSPAGTSTFNQLKDWSVVAFRYDPCAPADHSLPETQDCLQELRLVAQPYSSVGLSDSAMHLIYQMAAGKPSIDDPVMADLVDLKLKAEEITAMTSSGKALGVHPLLSAALAQDRPEVGKLFAAFLSKYAKPERLTKLTMMGLKEGSQTHWIFFGGDIIDGHWKSSDIPNLSNNPEQFVELNLNGTEIFHPVPDTIPSSTFGFFHRELLAPGEFQIIKNVVHDLENPAIFNRNNSDCLSCHSATSLRVNPNTRSPLYIEGKTATAPKGITAYPMPGILQRHHLHWNMRALGYFGLT